MKPRLVSVIAILFCGAILAIVGLFGYTRYTAAQAGDAAFSQQLKIGGQPNQAQIGTTMPAQLPPRATSAAVAPAASPQPTQQ